MTSGPSARCALVVSLGLGEKETDGASWPPTSTLVVRRQWSGLTYDNSGLTEVFTPVSDTPLTTLTTLTTMTTMTTLTTLTTLTTRSSALLGDDVACPRAENGVTREDAPPLRALRCCRTAAAGAGYRIGRPGPAVRTSRPASGRFLDGEERRLGLPREAVPGILGAPPGRSANTDVKDRVQV